MISWPAATLQQPSSCSVDPHPTTPVAHTCPTSGMVTLKLVPTKARITMTAAATTAPDQITAAVAERNAKRIESERNQSPTQYPHAIRDLVGPTIASGTLVATVDIASHAALNDNIGLMCNTADINVRLVNDEGKVERGHLTGTSISEAPNHKSGERSYLYVSQGSGGSYHRLVGADRAAALAYAQALINLGFGELACDDGGFEANLAAMNERARDIAQQVHALATLTA